MDAQGLFAAPQSRRPSRSFIEEGRSRGFSDEQIEELWFLSEGATPAPMPADAPPLVPGKNMAPLPVPKPETLGDMFRSPQAPQNQNVAPAAPAPVIQPAEPTTPTYKPSDWVPDPIERGFFGMRPQRQGVSEIALGAEDLARANAISPDMTPEEIDARMVEEFPMQWQPGTAQKLPPSVLAKAIENMVAAQPVLQQRAEARIEKGAERAEQGKAALGAIPVGQQQQNIQDAMQDGTLPTIGAFATNPKGALGMLGESVASQPAATALGAATIAAPMIGAPLAMTAATEAEREASLQDQLQRAGIDPTDPDAVKQFVIENPGLVRELNSKAFGRGAAIAAGGTAADIVSGGLGGSLLQRFARDAAVGTASDAATEALGQVITDEEVYSGPEIVAEGVLGGGQQIVQGAAAAAPEALNALKSGQQKIETLSDLMADDLQQQSRAAVDEQAERNTSQQEQQNPPPVEIDPVTGEVTLNISGPQPEQQQEQAAPVARTPEPQKVETLADVLNAQPAAQGDLVPGQNIVPGPQYQGSGQTPDAAPTAPKQTPAQQAQEPAPATAPTASSAPVVADNATSQQALPNPKPVEEAPIAKPAAAPTQGLSGARLRTANSYIRDYMDGFKRGFEGVTPVIDKLEADRTVSKNDVAAIVAAVVGRSVKSRKEGIAVLRQSARSRILKSLDGQAIYSDEQIAETLLPEAKPVPSEGPVIEAPEGITPSPRVDLSPEETQEPEQQPVAEAKPQVQKPTVEKVVTPSSEQEIEVEYQVKELSELTQGKGIQQNRDRSSKTSDNQLNEIYAKFDPTRLGKNRVTSDGAPIIDEAGNIEVGNGRTRVIERVYQESPEKAQAYRDQIAKEGFSTEGFEQPVLVRVRKTPLDNAGIQSLVAASNKPTVLGLNANEQAATDAAAVSAPSLDLYMGGGIEQLRNRSFVNAVLEEIASGPERGSLTRDGNLTQEAFRRVRAAMLQKAYDGGLVIEEMFDNENTDVKGLGNAMIDAAPIVAQLRNDIEAGRIDPKYDIGPDVNEALEVMKGIRHRMRTEGVNYADAVKQLSFLEASPKAQQIAEAFYKATENRPMSRQAVADFLTDYAMEARQQNANEELSQNQSPEDILTRAREKQLQEYDKGYAGNPADQGVLLKKVPGTGDEQRAGPESLDARTKSASKPNVVSRQGIAKRSGETGVRHLFGIPLDDWNAMGFDKKLGYVVKALRNEYGFASIKMDRRLSKQTILDQALDLYGNFEAMTDVLGVSRKAISLNGKIGLTFQNEPRAGVIGRFTYKKNRNDIAHIASVARNSSFAHEWWHAIDNFLVGQVKGKLLSENLPNRRKRGNDPALEIKQAYSELLMALFNKDQAVRAAEIRDIEMQLEEIDAGGRGVTAKRNALQAKINQLHADMNTDIGERSKGDMRYTGRIAEMTARAFEAIIADWMLVRSNLDTARGIVYEGLTDLDAQDSIAEAYPSVEDRRALDNAFKRVIRSVVDDGLLDTNAGQTSLPRETTTGEDIAGQLPERKEPLIHDPVREMHAETEQELVGQREAEVSLNQRLTRQQKRNRMLAFGDTRDLSLFNIGKKGRAVLGDLRGRLLALRRLGGASAKLKRVIDLIVDAPGSGRNQKLTVGQARKKAGQQFAYDVDRVLRRANISKQEMPYVYAALDTPNYDFNRVPADMRNAVRKKTGLIRDLFSDLLARQNYAVNRHLKAQVGPNIMATDSYVPGVYDMLKIAKDYQGFQEAAAKDYADDIQQRVAMNHSVTGANGILTAKEAKRYKVENLEDLTPDVIEEIAQDRADAWVYAIKNDVGQTATTSSQHHTKSRSLLPTARKNTAKFRIQNVNVLARAYAEMAADVTAWYETVGPGMSKNGTVLQPKEHLEQLIENALADIGDLTSKADRDLGAKMLRYVAGLEHGNGYSALEEVHQLVTSVMLVKTAATQITEAATMILAEGDVGGYFKHLASQLRVLGNHAAPRWLGNKRAYTQYIEEIGALAGVGAELQMSLAHQARAGLDPDAKRPHSGGLAKLTQASYRYSLMAGHMMMMQRLGAVHAFNRMLRLAKSYKKGNLSAFNKTELKDLGIYDDFDKVADELVRLGNNPSPRDLRESKYFQQISDAMHVYVANHFLEPTRLDKPMFASENGFGRLWWSLSSYSSAFNSRVLKVAIKRRAKAAEAGATEAALNSITLTTQFAGFVVFGILVQRVLVAAANGDMDKLEKLGKDDEEAWAEYVKSFIPTVGDNEDRAAFLLELVSYSDILGPLGNKALEIGTGARYKQDPLLRALPGSATFLGASISKRAEAAFGRNSENTDTVEHKIWRADYNWLRTFYHLGSVSAVNALTGIPVPNSTPAFLMRAAIVGSNFFVHGKKARDMAGDKFGGVTTKFKLEGLNPEHRYGTKNTKSSEKSSNKPRTYADLLKGD